MTEQELAGFVGKNVEITFTDNEKLTGKGFYFTRAIDNDPEIAELSVQTESGPIEVRQDEIKSVKVVE